MAPNSPGIPGLSSFSPIAITAGIAQFQIVRLVIPCRSHYAWWKNTIFIGMYWLYWYLYVSQHPPFSDNLRYLCRFAQYSGFPCVVKSWRGIGCDLSSARPETWDPHAVKETGNETVRIGLETNRKTSKSNGKFSFSYFCWPFHHWRKTHEVPLWHHWSSITGYPGGGDIPQRCLSPCQADHYGLAAWLIWRVCCCLLPWHALTGTAEETRSHGGNVALCALAQGQHLFDAGFACSLRWNDVKWSIEFLQWVCFVSDFGHLRCHQQNLQSSQSSKFWSQAFWFRRHPTSLLQFPPWSRSGFLMPTWTPSVPRWNYGSYFGGWHQAMDAPCHISTVDIRGPSTGPWASGAPSGWGIYQNISQEVNRQVITRADPLMDERLKVAKDREWTELSGEKGQLVMLMKV